MSDFSRTLSTRRRRRAPEPVVVGTRSLVSLGAQGSLEARVQQAIDQLVEANVLLLLPGGRRNRQWEAAGLLDLLADLEAGTPR